jgi:TatD DNase family protein
MTSFIDTHTHLYDKEFENDIGQVVSRAIGAGITKVILPGIDSSVWDSQCKVISGFPLFAYGCAGLHPTSVGSGWRRELDYSLEKIESPGIVAVGEIGLDCYWSVDFLDQQILAFEEQLRAAAKRDLPVIIHSRGATELIFKSLEKLKDLGIRGVFHAFSGSYETYQRIRKTGNFMVGIGGVITFKNSKLSQVVERMDKDDIVLETDAPWLAPTPYRGKRNEPAYIREIATKVAEVIGCDLEEVAKITTDNAIRLFKIDK